MKGRDRERCNRKWPALGHSGIIREGVERSNWTGDPRQNLHIRPVYMEDWGQNVVRPVSHKGEC